MKRTLVLGASLKPERYSNMAIQRLISSNHEVVAYGPKEGTIAGVDIDTTLIAYEKNRPLIKNDLQVYKISITQVVVKIIPTPNG